MIHERQREDMAGMGVGGELWALEGMSSQSPEAKRNLDITSVCSQHTTARDGNRFSLYLHGPRMFRGKGNRGRRCMVLENKILKRNLEVNEDRIFCVKMTSEMYSETELL